MNEHIKLTADQKDQIKGIYGDYSAIEPIAYQDGFIVPLSCIDNPDLIDCKELLQSFISDNNIIIPELQDEDTTM
jgi:hypothetical protein